MAVDHDSFILFFPEFTDASEALITEHINDAVIRTPSDIWGTLTDQGVKWLAAHTLAKSPWGRHARLVSDNGSTVYGTERSELAKSVAAGGMWVPGVSGRGGGCGC